MEGQALTRVWYGSRYGQASFAYTSVSVAVSFTLMSRGRREGEIVVGKRRLGSTDGFA